MLKRERWDATFISILPSDTLFSSKLLQAVHSCAQMQILRCKMLVGKSQTLSDLHRSGAGCAFFPNAIECVNAHSLRKSGVLFGASVNGIIPKFMIE